MAQSAIQMEGCVSLPSRVKYLPAEDTGAGLIQVNELITIFPVMFQLSKC